jgi:hypothetical protein
VACASRYRADEVIAVNKNHANAFLAQHLPKVPQDASEQAAALNTPVGQAPFLFALHEETVMGYFARVTLSSVFLLGLIATLPAFAGTDRDLCFDVEEFGVLRLSVIHSKADKMFVIVGQREVEIDQDVEVYAVSGSLIKTPQDGFKATLVESGMYPDQSSDDGLYPWSAHWSIDIEQNVIRSIAFIGADGETKVTEALLIPCKDWDDNP